MYGRRRDGGARALSSSDDTRRRSHAPGDVGRSGQGESAASTRTEGYIMELYLNLYYKILHILYFESLKDQQFCWIAIIGRLINYGTIC